MFLFLFLFFVPGLASGNLYRTCREAQKALTECKEKNDDCRLKKTDSCVSICKKQLNACQEQKKSEDYKKNITEILEECRGRIETITRKIKQTKCKDAKKKAVVNAKRPNPDVETYKSCEDICSRSKVEVSLTHKKYCSEKEVALETCIKSYELFVKTRTLDKANICADKCRDSHKNHLEECEDFKICENAIDSAMEYRKNNSKLRQKCFDKCARLKKEGRCPIFATVDVKVDKNGVPIAKKAYIDDVFIDSTPFSTEILIGLRTVRVAGWTYKKVLKAKDVWLIKIKLDQPHKPSSMPPWLMGVGAAVTSSGGILWGVGYNDEQDVLNNPQNGGQGLTQLGDARDMKTAGIVIATTGLVAVTTGIIWSLMFD